MRIVFCLMFSVLFWARADSVLSKMDLKEVVRQADVIVLAEITSMDFDYDGKERIGSNISAFLYEVKPIAYLKRNVQAEIRVIRVPEYLGVVTNYPQKVGEAVLAFLQYEEGQFNLIQYHRTFAALAVMSEWPKPDELEHYKSPLQKSMYCLSYVVRSSGTNPYIAVLVLAGCNSKLARQVLKTFLTNADLEVAGAAYYGLIRQGQRELWMSFLDWYFSEKREGEVANSCAFYVREACNYLSDVRDIPVVERILNSKDPLLGRENGFYWRPKGIDWIPYFVKHLDNRSKHLRLFSASCLDGLTLGKYGMSRGSQEVPEEHIQFWKEWWDSGRGEEFIQTHQELRWSVESDVSPDEVDSD